MYFPAGKSIRTGDQTVVIVPPVRHLIILIYYLDLNLPATQKYAMQSYN